MQTNNNQPQNALTLPFEVEDYLACKTMQGLAPGTIENYRLILTLFFRSTNKLPNEIITNDIHRFLYNYQEKKKISRVTLDKYREYISRFFSWAHKEGLLASNPAATLAVCTGYIPFIKGDKLYIYPPVLRGWRQ